MVLRVERVVREEEGESEGLGAERSMVNDEDEDAIAGCCDD